MVKLLILFKHPANESQFEQTYVRILSKLEQLPGIVRRQANMVLGAPQGKSPYYRTLELYFNSFNDLDAAMTSDKGLQAGRELMTGAGDLVELVFVDVFEDDTPVDTAE